MKRVLDMAYGNATAQAHDHQHDHTPTGWRRWLFSTNHKDIGSMYLVFSIIAALIGAGFSVYMRLELMHPGVQYMTGADGAPDVVLVRESAYQQVRVDVPAEYAALARPHLRRLVLDGFVHGYADLEWTRSIPIPRTFGWPFGGRTGRGPKGPPPVPPTVFG